MASLAVSDCGHVIAEMTWPSGQNHTVELLPNLLHLLRQAKIELKQIEALIVATGPGSFNGLRAGIATAKGLAISLGIPVVGISTLEADAYPHAETGLPICPLQNAGRGEIATALFRVQDGMWQRIVAEHITTVPNLCATITTETVMCGWLPDDIAQTIIQHARAPVIIASGIRRAGFLAKLGWQRIERGETESPITLQPLYLRPPSVTKSKKKEITR